MNEDEQSYACELVERLQDIVYTFIDLHEDESDEPQYEWISILDNIITMFCFEKHLYFFIFRSTLAPFKKEGS